MVFGHIAKTVKRGAGRATCLALLAFLAASFSSCGPQPIVDSPGYDLLEADAPYEGVGYEIFTGSFADGNGDGQGDLIGIKDKVPYLEALGIRRVWLTPFYPTNSYHGYDVSDYYGVRQEYGTLEDFDALVDALHEAGIEIIIDLVLNHSSSTNPWFLQSAEDYRDGNEGEDSKKDWYVWSENSGNGFAYNATAGAYYEANFDVSMPEFNCDNPEVREEFSNIARFWLEDHDVDGFRLDAAIYYYYGSAPRNVEFLTWFKGVCEGIKPECYVIGEAWVTGQSTISTYQASGLNFFNFPTSEMKGNGPAGALNSTGQLSYLPDVVVDAVERSQKASPETCLSFFVANHDTDRSNGYFAAKGAETQGCLKKMLASLYLLTPGTPWMYYGEEIDMWGSKGGHGNDVPRRLAMVWGRGHQRAENPEGYDDSSTQVTKGAYDQLAEPYSLLNHYRMVISLRNSHPEAFAMSSKWSVLPLGLYCPAFEIEAEGKDYYLIHNVKEETSDVTLPGPSSIAAEIQTSRQGASLSGTSLSIPAYSTVLLEA